MKIRDLVQRSGVSKETIHYYIREGLLPKPRKRGRNTADYDERFIEQIRVIKELQDHHFLPLSVIKNVLKYQKKIPEWDALWRLSSDHFRPVDRLLPSEITGEAEFCRATGIGEKWLSKMEEWEVITPGLQEGRKVYSQDDITIGKLIVEMDALGLRPRAGFDPEALRIYRQLFQSIVAHAHKYFMEACLGNLPPEEYSRKMLQAREIMAIFCYHLYRKLSREDYKRILTTMKSPQAPSPNPKPLTKE